MYQVQVTNQSQFTFSTSDGKQIPPNGTWSSGVIGSAWIGSPQSGAISFLDIAGKHIGGDTGQTWGVLISYQGEEIVGRYEGGGKLNVTINAFGQATLGGMALRRISLPAMLLEGEATGGQLLAAEGEERGEPG